jgi:hypothetical protein
MTLNAVCVNKIFFKLDEGCRDPAPYKALSPRVPVLILPGWQNHQSSVMKLDA